MQEYVKQTLFVIIVILLSVWLVILSVKFADMIFDFNTEPLSYKQKVEQELLYRCTLDTDDNGNDHGFADCILAAKEYLDNPVDNSAIDIDN